jgi:radical SAM protein with 4Fe4S-binding SPASM domain
VTGCDVFTSIGNPPDRYLGLRKGADAKSAATSGDAMLSGQNVHREFFVLRDVMKALKALLTRRVEIYCDGIPYRYRRVPLGKLLNWIRVEASLRLRTVRPWGLPTHLQVEPTNFCNLKCALCPVTTGMKRPSGFLNVDLFKRIIDEVGDMLFLVLLWDWGEPFLHPGVYEMIEYARKRDIRIVSSTNGHVFAEKENAVKVVRSGLDTLIFAVDGLTQETYKQYRCGGNLERVLEGIRQVINQKRLLGSSTPLVNLRFLVMKHNEHEISGIRHLAQSLGVDALTFRTLCPLGSHEHSGCEGPETGFLPENALYQRFRRDQYTKERIRRKLNPCKNLWNNPVIHWNGCVCSCSFDADEKYAMGRLANENFRQIWTGRCYLHLRRRFRRNYRDIPLCAECTYSFEGGTCSTEDILEATIFTRRTDGKETDTPGTAKHADGVHSL